MAPIIAAALKLAPLVPGLAGLIFGDRAEEAAEKVVSVAKAVSGEQEADAAIQAVMNKPELLVQLQQAVMDLQREVYIQDTERLKAVNETARAEAASADPYTRRWRPTFGYAACATWVIQGLVISFVVGWVIIKTPERIQETLAALTSLMAVMADHWLYALAVLGVAVWKRSEDKRTAAGVSGGLLDSLSARIKGK